MRSERGPLALVVAAALTVTGLSAAAQTVTTTTPPPVTTHSVAIGADHVLFVAADGTVVSLGSNRVGQLGVDVPTGSDFDYQVPSQVLTDAVQVAAGDAHSLVVKRDGTLWTFGSNLYGQLGTPTNAGTAAPNSVPTMVMTDVVRVAASQRVSLAVRKDGTLWGFGQSHEGQLGPDVSYSALTSTPVRIMTGVVDVAVGYNHVLVVKTDGSVWSWGANYNGQLGTETYTRTGVVVTTPVRVMAGAIGIAAGFNHSLVVKADGSLWTFGANSDGQLGGAADAMDVDVNVQPVPTKVMDGVAQAAAGDSFSIVRGTDGRVWTFGRRDQGQLGRSAWNERIGVVMDGASDVAASWKVAAVRRVDGTVWRFGSTGRITSAPMQIVPYAPDRRFGPVLPMSAAAVASAAFQPLCAAPSGLLDWFRVIVVRLLHVTCPATSPLGQSPAAGGPTTVTAPPSGTVLDCGGYNDGSGWPSTPAPPMGVTDCIVKAFGAGTPARFVMWTNTGAVVLRMLRTTYEVVAPHLVRVTTDPTRAGTGDEITVQECTQFFADWLDVRVAGCRTVATRPVTAPTPSVEAVLTSPSSVVAGQPVTMTVTVTAPDGRPITSGYVMVSANNAYTEAESRPAGDGRTTFTFKLRAGTYSVRAYFSGVDDEYRAAASAPVSFEVRAA